MDPTSNARRMVAVAVAVVSAMTTRTIEKEEQDDGRARRGVG
jgi:hypothetical protein